MLRNSNHVVVKSPDHENLAKSIEMSNFTKKIANKTCKRVRYLTKGTGNRLAQACNELMEMSAHLVYVMRCAIWYHRYNLQNVKSTHGGVLIFATLLKLTLLHWYFSRFLNCTNGTKRTTHHI